MDITLLLNHEDEETPTLNNDDSQTRNDEVHHEDPPAQDTQIRHVWTDEEWQARNDEINRGHMQAQADALRLRQAEENKVWHVWTDEEWNTRNAELNLDYAQRRRLERHENGQFTDDEDSQSGDDEDLEVSDDDGTLRRDDLFAFWAEGKIKNEEVEDFQEWTIFDIENAGMTRTFTCFSKLPPELRITIWGYAACVQRCIDIWKDEYLEGYLSGPGCSAPLTRWVSRTPVPSILHTSTEARDVGLRFYKLAFGSTLQIYRGYDMSPHEIYINFEHDILCPARFEDLSREERMIWWEAAQGARRIALNTGIMYERLKWQVSVEIIFHRNVVPKSVEEIILYSLDTHDLEPDQVDLDVYYPENKPRIRASYLHIGFNDLPEPKPITNSEVSDILLSPEMISTWSDLAYIESAFVNFNQKVLWEAAKLEDSEEPDDSPQKFLESYHSDEDIEWPFDDEDEDCFDIEKVDSAQREIMKDLEKEQPGFEFKFKVMVVNGQAIFNPVHELGIGWESMV